MACGTQTSIRGADLSWKVVSAIPLLVLFCFVAQTGAAEITYHIIEQQPANTAVGNIANDYDLSSTMSSGEFNNLVYRILGSGNVYAPLFRIVNTTGQLYTTEPIDRDNISHCAGLYECAIPLDISMQAGSFFRKINIEIVIEDINDNSPEFPSPFDSTQFSENSVVGTSNSISGAKDKDTGNNTVMNYYIETKGVPFTVSMEKKPDGFSVVKIVVAGELDRERQDLYKIKVVAQDGGFPKRTGTVEVTIKIIDVNDNTPSFDRVFYNVTLKEDVAVNTVVETISASDPDQGENGEITYSLSANQNDISGLFAINSSTGELSVVGQLVYTTNEMLKVYVEASDKGVQPRTAQVVVYVNITDTSNNPPEIHVNILSGDVDARVSEYANIGAVVAHIGVVDRDTGRNGKVDCIGVSDKFQLEKYDTNEYKVVVRQALNRELQATHEVRIICSDAGSPPLNTTTSFRVQVMDENNNQPRFSHNTYYAKAEENTKVGDVVAKVYAEDADDGKNAEIEYSLKETNGFDFWMDSATGEIRANFILDRENVSQITLRVKASDRGSPRLSSEATVILTVTDQNDNYPLFSQPNYEFFVSEGFPNNMTVDQLTAIDKDFGVNGTISFSFETLPSSNFPFILISNGTIKMIRQLDRETQSKYEFVVIASDMGTPPLSSSVTVTVVVQDVNDNAPQFIFPEDENNTATIPLTDSPDLVTIIVSAFDADEGINSDLHYSIIDSNASDLFDIRTRNGMGVIKVLRYPSGNEPLTYNLKLKAEDGGTPRRSAIKTLTVAFIKKEQPEEGKNFLIAVALGCVTVVLSIAIVLTICLIRRHDRRRNKNCSGFEQHKAAVEIVPAGPKPFQSDLGSSSSGSKESLKKVSFSTDFNSTLDSDPSRDMPQAPLVNLDSIKYSDKGRHSSSSPRSCTSSPHPGDSDMQKLDPARVLQLHRSLLQSHDQYWTNNRDGHTPVFTSEMLVQHEDNGSDSSGETATCDSGRGGSESDIQTSYSQSHDTDHIKTVTFANQAKLHHFPINTAWRSNKEPSANNLYVHKDQNKPTKPSLPKRDYSTDISRPGQRTKHTHVISPGYDSHVTSYDDDDDTTTSGSYTIDNDDWMNDPQQQSRGYSLSHNEAYC